MTQDPHNGFYRGQVFHHGQAPKIGVLLTNLGTPAAPTKQALKPYLREFLSDPRVVEVPRLLWWFILNGIILNVRPAKSAEAYRRVWTDRGSPLAYHTAAQAQLLAERLQAEWGDRVIVDWAMRYGDPSIANAIQRLQDEGVRQLLVLPLYPQYSGATTASTFDALAADFTQRRWLPELRFATQYHDHPQYIAALAQSIEQHWQVHGRADKLIFSYHGIPLRYLHAGDPYHCQCLKTTRLVAEHLGLSEDQYLTSFQSRFGREPWLKPYTDETIQSLPGQGVKHIQVICPGFAADCLETIDEIDVENREFFLEAGGERFDYIPALNSEPVHIDLLHRLVSDQLKGWEAEPAFEAEQAQALYEACSHNR